MQRMLVSLPAIEQAKGILIAMEECTAEDAFGMLRAASQRMNIPLRDVARRLVDRYERRALLAHARRSRDVSKRLVKEAQELMTPEQSRPTGRPPP